MKEYPINVQEILKRPSKGTNTMPIEIKAYNDRAIKVVTYINEEMANCEDGTRKIFTNQEIAAKLGLTIADVYEITSALDAGSTGITVSNKWCENNR